MVELHVETVSVESFNDPIFIRLKRSTNSVRHPRLQVYPALTNPPGSCHFSAPVPISRVI